MPNSFIELTEDEWFDKYKPIKNHLDENSSFDGHMFETYGDEVEFVKQAGNGHIWMYGDGDDGGTYLWNGWGFVNRIGYFITEIPFGPDETIQVKISDPWYFCENCDTEMEDPDNLINDKFGDLEKCPNCATLEEIQQLEKE